MMMVPTTEPMAMAEAAGQPTSMIESDRPKRVTMAVTAPARSVPMSWLMTRLRPMKPMPTVRPALRLLPKPHPKRQPMIVSTIGMTTDTPRLDTPVKNPTIASMMCAFYSWRRLFSPAPFAWSSMHGSAWC